MSAIALAAAHAATVTASSPGPGFDAPGLGEFVYPPLFPGIAWLHWLNKPLLDFIISLAIVFLFFWIGARKRALVPGRLQFAIESVYDFIRNSIAREVIGPEFAKFVPFLVTIFGVVLVNNIFGVFPLVQFPSLSRVGLTFTLAIFVWLVYLYVGMKRQGPIKYFTNAMFPPGIPWPVLIILAPVELLQLLIFRPFTLAVRLAANMFAGHLLLLLFTLGGWYMLHNESFLLKVLSPVSLAAALGLTSFEAFIEVLQAYIFTLLAALYIQEALQESH